MVCNRYKDCFQYKSTTVNDAISTLDFQEMRWSTIGFSDSWNTKTENEPWWQYIEEAASDPSMLNKHPTLADTDLLKIYCSTTSARERAKDSSGVFTTKGNFKGRGQYDYLREYVQKHPALGKSADGNFKANKRHRVHCTWNLINKIPVCTGFVKVSTELERIVVGITRTEVTGPVKHRYIYVLPNSALCPSFHVIYSTTAECQSSEIEMCEEDGWIY